MKKLQTYFYLNSAFIYTKERKESMMTVIAMKKADFTVTQYNNVTNIAYTSGNYVITYGSSQSATLNSTNYVISILFS